MSVAIIDKNSKLGIALAEKRRKKQYGEETSAVTSAPSEQVSDTVVEISRNSKLGQYLAGNANAMFSNIAKSAAEKSGEYEQTSKNFNSWAKANEKFINDRDGAKKYSDTFRQYADGIDRQLNRLRSLGVKSGDSLYDSLEEQKKYFTSNLDWLNNMSQYKNKIQAAIGTTDDVMNYSAPALRNALRRKQGLPYLSEDEFNAELKKRNDRLIADIDTAVKNKRKLNGEKFSADELENYPDYIKELLRKRKDVYASNIQIEVPYGKTAEEYSALISDYDAQIEQAKANGGTGNVLADTARRALIHNGTLRKQGDEASEKLKALQHKKALAEKYRDIAAVNRIKGSEDEALFKELDELGWQNQGQRVRNLFAGATGNINPDMGTQYNENLKRIEEIKAVLRSKGYDTDAYINAYHKATNAETAEEFRKDAAEFAKNHPVIGGIALPVAANFVSGAANLVGYAMGESGQDSPYNIFGNVRNASVESRAAAIEANHIKEDGTVNSLGKVLSTLYRAAESSLESITLNKAFGKGAELIMSLNAAADTYNTAVDDGLDFPNAFATAFSAGVFEAFFEHISLEKLRYFDQHPAAYNDILGNIKNLLKGFFTEGSEEVFTDIANSFTDYLINGGLSEYERFKAEGGTASEFAKQKGADILQSFIVGGLSGAMFTGAGITRNVAANVGANTETGNDIRRGIKAGELSIYDVAEAKNHISQDSDAAQYLGAIDTNADVYKTGKKPLSPKWYKAGRAYNEAGRQSVADTANAAQRLTKGEITDSEYLDTVVRAGNIAKISEQINLASRKASKKEQRRMKEAEERTAQRKAKIEQADRRIEADGAKINKAVRSGNTAKLVKNRSEGVRSDGLDVSLGAVTGVENGRISVEFDPDTHAVAAFDASGAETVTDDSSAAKTVKASSPEINALYEGINRAVTGTVEADSGTDVTGRTVNTGTKMSVNAANLALSMYNETANADASVYTRIMYETYKAGKRGLPFETLRESIAAEYDIGAYDGTVTGTQIKQMYKAGASEFEARPGVQRIGVKSVTTGEHKNALTQLSAIDLFAKKHGITIIAVDSLTDAEGNAINGEYRTGNNIVISLDADGGLYMPVVGHEIFHYAENINAEDAKALAELIIDTLRASKGAEWLEARRREYAGYGYKDGKIDSEIAADFFGAAVTQKEFERQIKAAELNKSFAQKIIDKVKEVVAELKEIMRKLRGQRLIYDAALDTDAETLDFFVDNLERILNQAGTETKNTATEDGVKYQLKVGAAADVEKALKDKNYRDDVYLTESSPAVIANQNGVRNLPMLMKASHIRENVFTEDEARQRGLKVDKNINYHGLGKDLFLKIIDGLDDVQYAYRGTKNADNPSRRENYFLLISQYKDGDGNTINVPVFINEQGQYNRVFIETNKIATVFGRNDMLAYLQREVKKGNLVRIKNKSTQASERTTPIVAGYSLNASVDTTVTQKSPSVNSILSENPKKITKFQKKLPDVQEKLKKMSSSDDIDDVKRMAYGLADDFMKYAKAARLEMTETRGLMPQPTRVSEIVAKYNDYRKTGVSNKQLESDITDIFTDYMNGVGSSGTLFNYITDTIMKRELNSYEVIGDETFKAVRAYTDGGRFKVSDATVGSLVDTFGSLGEINGILRENYGFTIAKETDTRAENRAVWAPVGAQLAEEAGHVFDGTDYTENAKGGFEYETLASLLQTAQNDPRIYRGWLTGANTPDERILAQDELADRVEEEALKMYGELMSAPARNTKADRYKKMLFDYSVKHAAQLDRLENRLAENKLRVEELKAENRAKMQELRGTKNEEIETVKQAYRERIKTQRVKRNETASKAKVRSQITKRVKVLNALLTRETDAKHIPQELKHTVAEFLLPFTEDSSVFGKAKDDVLSLERYVRMNDLLTDIYNATEGDSADGAALNERYRSLAGNLDGDLVRDFGEMRRTMAGKRLSRLSLDELQTVNKIVVNIANMVKQGRETFINGKKESLDEIGRETVSDLTSRRQRRKHLKPVDWAIDLMNDKETTPIYFFGEKLGGFFGQIYRDIRDAQDKWYVRCAEAQRSIEDLQNKYNFKKWAGKADKGVTFTLDDGGTVTLTKEQILSVYATAKRERTGGNNTTHVFDGGIVVDDELRRGLKDKISTALAQRSEKGKKAFSDAFSEQIRSEARHLTVNDLARITAALTDEQKAYADSVVGLLSTTVGGWGNETSMEMYGYKKFTEDYYFPVMSDKSYLYTRFGISDDTRLKHAGFTNKVVRGANNPIIITGLTNVAAGHINQMALYSSFTVPIENMTKLYNYELSPTEDADGHTVRGMSVKKALTNAYGKAANEYIADFMRALNGGIKADSVENFLDWGTSKFKRAAVMANLSVIVQQPSAIARATALINPKYLVGVPNETLPKTVAEMYKYSAVAGIKKLGGFDTGTGMSVTQWISNSEQSFSEKASDLLGKGAEKADEVTWANIWAAVKRELNARIRSGKSELKPGSEEYYRAVADRFRDIIDYTQVYDSVLSKSQLMRSKSGLVRMMTSFMAEPTLSYNLVVNSFKGGTINGGRAIAAFAANVVLNTLLQSLVAALRDKEDISYWERYIKNVTESLTGGKLPVAGSEFNVFGNLPLVKDAISVMQGYDVPRTDMSLVTDAADVLKKLMKVTANREKLSGDKSKKYKNMTLYQEKLFDVLWDAGVMITNFTPLPMQSVSREIKGVINNVSHWAGDAEHYRTTSYTLRDAIKEGAGFGEDNPLKAYNALKNKEDEVLRRLKQSDSWQTWVRKGLKEYDRGDDLDKKAINRIEKAATANYSGDYDTYERLVGAIEKEGFDRNDILAAVESLVGDMRPKEEPDEPADKHLYTTKMLKDAIRQDNSEAVKDIKQKLKDVEGKTDDNIRSAVKKIARESYYEKGDEDGAIRVLRDYGDMSADEIKDAIDWFSYSVLNPDSELVYNSWQSWRSKASNGQVNNGRGKLTAAQYEAYTQAVRGITGDDLDGDGKTDSGTKKKKVLAAINKLPLTKDQKNTLYLVNGYGKDSIGEAPWN